MFKRTGKYCKRHHSRTQTILEQRKGKPQRTVELILEEEEEVSTVCGETLKPRPNEIYRCRSTNKRGKRCRQRTKGAQRCYFHSHAAKW